MRYVLGGPSAAGYLFKLAMMAEVNRLCSVVAHP